MGDYTLTYPDALLRLLSSPSVTCGCRATFLQQARELGFEVTPAMEHDRSAQLPVSNNVNAAFMIKLLEHASLHASSLRHPPLIVESGRPDSPGHNIGVLFYPTRYGGLAFHVRRYILSNGEITYDYLTNYDALSLVGRRAPDTATERAALYEQPSPSP
ncbi:hypothetical protein FA95DRAFT_1612291 [Auriscalpium vulgare]|uniref:Uncharacterized protein n=1 Tax=Auriscalpium vulgare TaxID=40419 RepID=A0ACB8R6P9_9AGAM|nr:hypothetical protein FA95DRAFT_1612291 [Auriscalpium vulgare]